jgi:hypothetical protein
MGENKRSWRIIKLHLIPKFEDGLSTNIGYDMNGYMACRQRLWSPCCKLPQLTRALGNSVSLNIADHERRTDAYV